MEFGIQLRHASVMNLVSFYLIHSVLKWRELYLNNFSFKKKKVTLACIQTFTDRFLSN